MGWHVGVTGSRSKRPPLQVHTADRVMRWLWQNGYTHHHDGDCIGADCQCWQLATQYFITIGHPPIDPSQRAFMTYFERREPKHYLERNRDIVDEVHYLIGLPDSTEERVRSGTWSTIRYARKIGRSGCLIFPDGSVKAISEE